MLSPRSQAFYPIVAVAMFSSACLRSSQSKVMAEGHLASPSVWSEITSDVYEALPYNTVSLWKFASSHLLPRPDRLEKRAKDTLVDQDNIVPYFEKLVHPNGICLRGRWIVDTESPFTGAFKQGTNLPFIGRASVAFSDVRRGAYRAFGLAGKIFDESPRADTAEATEDQESANFFTIDDLAGTKAGNFTDVTLSNEPATTQANLLHQGPTVVAIGGATLLAFKLADKNPGIRQLYQISELGLADKSTAVTPKWMHLNGTTPMLAEHEDFREDLATSNFEGPLTFAFSVSSSSQDEMTAIGRVVIEESVTSETCDHRLHFNHPPFRDDLTYE